MSRTRRIFWLYRPTAPSVRAQSIQVVHAAHATASRGHRVTLCIQAATATDTPEAVLAFYGLQPIETLHLVVLPTRNTWASLRFRATFARWIARGGGVVVARSKRYADQALRWCGSRFTLVLEAHEVDSALARERGGEVQDWFALERRVIGASRAVVCNCEGTLDLLRAHHPALPPAAALHNATHPDRARVPEGMGEGIGYAGSLRTAKDPGLLADAAARLQVPLTVMSADRDDALAARGQGWLRFEGPVAHRQVPDRLVSFGVLALPVACGLFGERLTSPLKLFDYQAVRRPILAADTPALRTAAGDTAHWYRPGDVGSFCTRAQALLANPPTTRPPIRTWAMRAAELDALLDEALG